jgi:flavin reductase (DIM6/NTAB) family NADH-FMN oxidoreductase RutF
MERDPTIRVTRPAPIADPAVFRDLMSRFASGVTVVTAVSREGRPHGMTASAVAGLSLEPPLILLCVDLSSDLHPILCETHAFALSILATGQESLSRRFAAELPDRFEGVRVIRGIDGLPLLEGALAHITCRKWGQYIAGDHTIFVGQVSGGSIFDQKPLIHFDRGYRTTQ